MSASTGSGAGDDRRREATFTWVSTGRRIAAARVGRRWADIRGSLLAAATLALLQAALVYVSLRAIQELGLSLFLLVPIVAVTTLGLVTWLGLVRHAFGAVVPLGQAPAAKILEIVEALRVPLRDGLTETAALMVAHVTQSRLGYGAVAVTDRSTVLAHAGLASDHHGAGTGAPPGAVAAMAARRVARLPVGWGHGCDGRDCPLRSAVVAPLATRAGVVGSVILFSEGALNVSDRDRAIAQSLSDLLSTELQVGELDVHANAAASAELAALQAQIEPHFLFNALNTIAAFCRTRPDDARRLVLAFADYCRSSLRRPGAFVDFADELGHVDAYLALEEARFGESLEIERRIAPAALTARVPPFLVQPLVENAIKHGKTDRPLRVTITAVVRFGRLRVSVRDNGRGIPPQIAERVLEAGVGSGAAGLGLASVDQRLTALYGEDGRLRIVSSPLFGTVVSVLIPGPPARTVTLLALIVDDEAPARAELRFLLEGLGGVEVVGEAASVREALALASRVAYDVVFLDINMPDLTGMDAARELSSWPRSPAVVFVTARDDHAIQAFTVDAIDYLLKPVSEERLARSLQRVLALRAGGDPRRTAGPELQKVPVTRKGETLLLDADGVLYAEADGDYCWIHADGERLLSTKSMRELEDALPATIFFRIHRSYLVNLRRVVALETVAPGRSGVRLADGTVLEVARRQTRALKQHLGLR